MDQGIQGQDADRVRWAPIVPTVNEPEFVWSARLRRAVVLTCIRHGSVNPVEALAYLTEMGFVVAGDRPLEVVRKALNAEARGIYKRAPSLVKLPDNTYAYRSGSLTDRSLKRWHMQFPTI